MVAASSVALALALWLVALLTSLL